MRVLITGISGFVGFHLAQYLLSSNIELIAGLDLRSVNLPVDHYQGELTDRVLLLRVLAEVKPDVVVHLAGMVKSQDPDPLYKMNLLGTVALFDSIIESKLMPVVLLASSSAVYGNISGETPIDEKTDFHPMTHYAVSKVAQEMAALRCYNAYQLPVMILRMFNLLGPGQPVDLAFSSFARQIAMSELSGETEISTGNLNAQRDFVDVRDAVRAFMLAAEKGTPGEIYNVCSGRAVTIRKCLDEMISMSPQQIEVKIDAQRIQAYDVPIQIGNAGKLRQATGWQPEIPLKQSLSDLLDDWRQKVKIEAESK